MKKEVLMNIEYIEYTDFHLLEKELADPVEILEARRRQTLPYLTLSHFKIHWS